MISYLILALSIQLNIFAKDTSELDHATEMETLIQGIYMPSRPLKYGPGAARKRYEKARELTQYVVKHADVALVRKLFLKYAYSAVVDDSLEALRFTRIYDSRLLELSRGMEEIVIAVADETNRDVLRIALALTRYKEFTFGETPLTRAQKHFQTRVQNAGWRLIEFSLGGAEACAARMLFSL